MSDILLCPFRPEQRRYPPDDPFGPCLKEKCACWREQIRYVSATKTPQGVDGSAEIYGYCGIAGTK